MNEQSTLEVVAAEIRATLGIAGDAPIRSESLLFYDLSFTSLDMLDLLFRVESHFQIAIPEGTFYELTKGVLADNDFAQEGMLTPKGRERLLVLLYDSPPKIFPERIHIKTFLRYCTVGAIVRLVDYKLKMKVRD
ncbi:MAG: acpXL [Pedosphaera sp.]|nr:acpXL [Pedosphaera sp.]